MLPASAFVILKGDRGVLKLITETIYHELWIGFKCFPVH